MRITPAWAGKSNIDLQYISVTKDHPRVGGEKAFPTFWSLKNSGSPPRGRGKGIAGNRGILCRGITPA